MKRSSLSLVLLGVALLTLVGIANAFAAGTPSSKATADINTAVGCTVSKTTTIGDTLPLDCHDVFSGAAAPVTPDNFAEIMKATVKLSNSQSLFVSPSLVTGLYTNTKVRTSTGATSTATAMGGVYLRAVLYDSLGNAIVAEPIKRCTSDILGCYADANGAKGVVLDSRIQTLTQELSACVVTVGGLPTGAACDFTVTTQLILQTTSAHTFNFIFPSVGVGMYTLAIQVAANSNATVGGNGMAIGADAFGLGSVTAESVRLVHDFEF